MHPYQTFCVLAFRQIICFRLGLNMIVEFWCWNYHLSLVMRKPVFCICENKDADQLRGNRDQRLCFCYTDSTIPYFLNPKTQTSTHLLWLHSLVCVGLGRKPRRQVFFHNEARFRSTAKESFLWRTSGRKPLSRWPEHRVQHRMISVDDIFVFLRLLFCF